MSVFGRFEININVATQEELDKIAEAIFSGYAEHILKERILWGDYYTTPAQQMQGAQQPMPTPQNIGNSGQGSAPVREPVAPLQRIETHVSAPKVVAQEQKPARAAGVLGRGRMGRSKP